MSRSSPKDGEDVDTTVLNTMNARLFEVKNLFMTRRFKNCAGTCDELLNRTAVVQDTQSQIYECYLNFYAGLSYDALARNMPHAAPARAGMLSRAVDCYLAAEASLPRPASTPSPQLNNDSDEGLTSDDDDTPNSSRSSSNRVSLASLASHYSAYSLTSLMKSDTIPSLNNHNNSIVDKYADLSSIDSTGSFTEHNTSIIEQYLSLSGQVPRPSSLQLHTESKRASRLSTVSFNLQVPPTSSPDHSTEITTPPAPAEHPPDFAHTAAPLSFDTDDEDDSLLPRRGNLKVPPPTTLDRRSVQSLSSTTFARIIRYNEQLVAFSAMLHAHIAAVRELQQPVTAAPARLTKRAGRESRGLNKSAESDMERGARRKELVRRALARERFRPEKYQDLAHRALCEI